MVAENATAKSAECHAAPTAGLLWFLITLITLLRNLHSKHRHTPWEMFSEHPWRVAVYTTMSPKSQVGPLIFSIGVLITKRINSDLFRPSVHHPLFLPHAPYEFLMANHILGVWPATILCKFFSTRRKDYCQKCRWPCLGSWWLPTTSYTKPSKLSTETTTSCQGRSFPRSHGMLL